MINSLELKDLMLKFYESISRGDSSLLEELLSHQPGMLWIGSDPREWWTERAEVLRVWKAQLEEMGGAMNIESTNLQAFEHGDIGWLADQVIGLLPSGATIHFRITAVCQREAQEWRIIQMHSSIGTPNEAVTGKGLTV